MYMQSLYDAQLPTLPVHDLLLRSLCDNLTKNIAFKKSGNWVKLSTLKNAAYYDLTKKVSHFVEKGVQISLWN